ncbi:MAG: GNAT family N-acetyltransferase, partial [Propionibacteriaceae bacterium]|nr:GNAT family N-acetyltransferase [Propionibacteriaceae bacterium]
MDSRVKISKPRPLTPEDDLTRFDCGAPGLDHWLKERALRSERNHDARTYVVTAGERAVVGFYCLSAAVVERESASGWLSRNAPDPVPVILIGRLAVDRRLQRSGLGAALLADAARRARTAAEHVGARAIVVDAPDQISVGFYQRFGFTRLSATSTRL